jgi:hypothetical protein
MDFETLVVICVIGWMIQRAVRKTSAFLGGDGVANEAGRRAVGWGLHKLFK